MGCKKSYDRILKILNSLITISIFIKTHLNYKKGQPLANPSVKGPAKTVQKAENPQATSTAYSPVEVSIYPQSSS